MIVNAANAGNNLQKIMAKHQSTLMHESKVILTVKALSRVT